MPVKQWKVRDLRFVHTMDIPATTMEEPNRSIRYFYDEVR